MIIAISRFTVKSGMEAQMRAAFAQRPRVVDSTPSFLGLEVFQQGASFVLLTRWVDEASFHAWHRSSAHHDAHTFLPPGLELDPAQTELIIAERIDGAGSGALEGDLAGDLAIPLAQLLREGRSLHVAHLDEAGRITRCNAAFAEAIGGMEPGLTLGARLTEGSRAALSARATGEEGEPIVLQIVRPDGERSSLRAFVRPLPSGMAIVAEPPADDEHRLAEELRAANAELSVLSRENVRKARLLEQAHRELRDTHWHLKKDSSVLPICMECKAVKTAEGTWEPAATFLTRNGDFLSHAYCPPCAERAEAEADEQP
ncbi:MAG: antibiotic biosynthesis monooxygenase [Minicystis sp.]